MGKFITVELRQWHKFLFLLTVGTLGGFIEQQKHTAYLNYLLVGALAKMDVVSKEFLKNLDRSI